ncbi:hypothetical protein QBC32DRAFT_371714 [Pseudoneurospora amorphoporcata]|uniref:Uncharacterized protein n=1 Tax=Pseudoneurospora amorphoporcata TaxID=241081 RepID=A0AAN6NRL2_9PEZI|nr:hypothetical protein QBC32DRAFT_371714 [Pseudoneurospora amorphoporcata]
MAKWCCPAPHTYQPKPMDVYLTDPLQTHDLSEKWANFWEALINDKCWSVATGYVQKPGPAADLSLLPTPNKHYATWPEARKKTKLAREILLSLGFVEVPSIWSPRIQMKWAGYPDREFVKNQMPQSLDKFERRCGNGKGDNGGGKAQLPDKEWIEFVKTHGPVRMRRERRGGWVASQL